MSHVRFIAYLSKSSNNDTKTIPRLGAEPLRYAQ